MGVEIQLPMKSMGVGWCEFGEITQNAALMAGMRKQYAILYEKHHGDQMRALTPKKTMGGQIPTPHENPWGVNIRPPMETMGGRIQPPMKSIRGRTGWEFSEIRQNAALIGGMRRRDAILHDNDHGDR